MKTLLFLLLVSDTLPIEGPSSPDDDIEDGIFWSGSPQYCNNGENSMVVDLSKGEPDIRPSFHAGGLAEAV